MDEMNLFDKSENPRDNYLHVNKDILEFIVFCIEECSNKLKLDSLYFYSIIKDKTDVMDTIIIKGYDVLHTQSANYIIETILDSIKNRGIKV